MDQNQDLNSTQFSNEPRGAQFLPYPALECVTGKGWRRFLRRAVLTWQRASSSFALVRDIARRAVTMSFKFTSFTTSATLHTSSTSSFNALALSGSSINSGHYHIIYRN